MYKEQLKMIYEEINSLEKLVELGLLKYEEQLKTANKEKDFLEKLVQLEASKTFKISELRAELAKHP